MFLGCNMLYNKNENIYKGIFCWLTSNMQNLKFYLQLLIFAH